MSGDTDNTFQSYGLFGKISRTSKATPESVGYNLPSLGTLHLQLPDLHLQFLDFILRTVLSSHHFHKCVLWHCWWAAPDKFLTMGFPPCQGNTMKGTSSKINLVLDCTVTDIEDSLHSFKPLS
ncbi:hypothetical protein Tco_0394120 [Tanacetum coccineum]